MIKIIEKIKNIWGLLLFLLFVFYFLFLFIQGIMRDYALDNNSKTIKGVVINKRNYVRNDKVGKSYTYSYQFILNGEKYKRNSLKKGLKIGDSILIEYYPKFPLFNRVKKNKN